MSDPSDRLERAIAQLGADHEPPPGWEAKVLAAVESPRAAAPERRPWLRRWWPAIPAAVLAAAVLVVVLRPVRPEQFALAVTPRPDASRGAMRGGGGLDDVSLGGVLDIAVQGGERRAVWVYRDSRKLVAACPRDAGCEVIDGALRLAWKVDQIGKYQVVALAGSQALPAPTGDYDRDLSALVQQRIEYKTQDVTVR
jgi:hypothetical protein